jgi:hypothetical protein
MHAAAKDNMVRQEIKGMDGFERKENYETPQSL